MKDGLRRHCFPDDNSVIAAVEKWVAFVGWAILRAWHVGPRLSLAKMHSNVDDDVEK